jgi:hypothetical protein
MLSQSSKSPCSVVEIPTARSAFWLIAVAALGCMHAPVPAAQGVGPADQAAVLAVVAESLWVRPARPQARNGVVLARDSLTIRALAALARRAGISVRQAAPQVWCSGAAGPERTVGTVAGLTIDSLTASRAIVRWSVTCLLTSPSGGVPFAGGELVALELVRRGRSWQVARTLYWLEL